MRLWLSAALLRLLGMVRKNLGRRSNRSAGTVGSRSLRGSPPSFSRIPCSSPRRFALVIAAASGDFAARPRRTPPRSALRYIETYIYFSPAGRNA